MNVGLVCRQLPGKIMSLQAQCFSAVKQTCAHSTYLGVLCIALIDLGLGRGKLTWVCEAQAAYCALSAA